MKKTILAAVFAAMLATPTLASEVVQGDITVSGAFARATAPRAKAGGAYMSISNNGEVDNVLSAASDVAKRTELHTHIRDGDVMRMRQVEAIEVPANGSVELKPGGYHIMFMGLKKPLKKGEQLAIELMFEKAGKVKVMVDVGTIGAMKPMDHSKMDHSKKN